MKKSGVIVALLAVAIFLGLFAWSASALSIHYELDKSYYHAADAGRLLLVCTNDESYDMVITKVEMSIDGIGTFKANISGLPLATDLPPNIRGHLLKTRQTANIEIQFEIPVDARPREYKYTWTFERFPGTSLTRTDALRVYATGEEPPRSESTLPMPLLLMVFPVLLVAYFVVKRRNRKMARALSIATVALLALFMVFGEGWEILYLAYMLLLVGFSPIAGVIILVLIILLAVVAIRRMRRKM